MRNKLVDNRYRIIARIGQGAMGKVFKAEHVYTRRPVALKIIHPQFQQDEQYRVRFLREIELACRIQHPNAVQILDAGEAESKMLYMAMEFLDGQTLSNLLKQCPNGLNLGLALRIAQQIGLALDTIHNAGLVHRDLKPDNIMVLNEPDAPPQNCTVKILDFGIARDVDTVHSLTGKMMIGTPKFMSPEQTRGEKLTQKSDIYNLGLILYAMLTGKEPFSSDSPVGYVFHHNMTQPAPVSSLRSDVPAHVEWAIEKALSKDPALRFETAEKFIATITVGHSGFKKKTRVQKPLRLGSVRTRSAHTESSWASSSVWKKVMALGIGAATLVAGTMFFLQEPSIQSRTQTEPFSSFDSTRVDEMSIVPEAALFNGPSKDALSIADLPIDSLFPVIITPNWDSLNADILEAEEIQEPSPAFLETPTIKTKPVEEAEEIDPNLLYYAKLGKQPLRSPLRYAALEKPIEENSNIIRLRAQQQRARQVDAQSSLGRNQQPNASSSGSALPANTLPRVQGGVEGLRAQLNYPVEAALGNVTGTVGVRLLIDESGEVIAEEITRSLGFGCDEEVLRVLQEAQFESARLENKPVKAWLNLQFSFQLVG